ncbi:complement receptor type 1-like isoform X4 [Phyllopteryx taeniolatus]|uniref:complement receptor type 1-like isoform X4 n=1 Tax=Phyllopteryx taeniolatus TaxID=161469 RepID=UPI002AD2EDAE|nr:complement receptor type 1-like isoform X4 [Phyllopteryx taeniolatus]
MYALQNMRSIVWHIMFLSISLFDTAEVPKRCSAPPQYPSTRFDNNLDTGRKFDSGEKVDYKCAEDLVAYTGSPSVMCVNGTWTTLTLKCEKVVTKCQWEPKPPQCLTPPACQGGCSAPANLDESHANLADDFISRTTFGPGERVRYTCDVGYSPVGGSRYRSCSRGQWTPLLLKCERKLCGSAGEIKNGRFMYTGVQFGDTATAHCDDGFQLVGRPTRNCMSFGWDGHAPFCEVVECEEPPEVANTERKGTEEAPYKYRSVVVYECRAGTLLGNKAIWCTEDGTWSTPPTCKEITCPSPKVPNGSWTRGHIRLYQHRDTIAIGCRHGYTVVGTSTVTCGDDGQWIPSLPKCRRTSWHTKWQSQYAVGYGMLH